MLLLCWVRSTGSLNEEAFQLLTCISNLSRLAQNFYMLLLSVVQNLVVYIFSTFIMNELWTDISNFLWQWPLIWTLFEPLYSTYWWPHVLKYEWTSNLVQWASWIVSKQIGTGCINLVDFLFGRMKWRWMASQSPMQLTNPMEMQRFVLQTLLVISGSVEMPVASQALCIRRLSKVMDGRVSVSGFHHTITGFL